MNPVRTILPRLAPVFIRWSARRGRRGLEEEQAGILRSILDSIAPTAWGSALKLSGLPRRADDLARAFRRDVPLHHYADMEAFLQRTARGEADVLFRGKAVALAQTSGTTSPSKAGERWIPQNGPLLQHHARGAMSALARLVEVDGGASLRGRVLMLGGSTALSRNEWNIPVGDLSGITVDRIPWYLEGLYEPGREIALEPDWTRKVERIADRLAHADVSLISGVPSWCLVLFEAVCRRRKVSRIRDAWPGLRGVVHGGASIDPYIPSLREHLPPDCLLQEVYPSSEAFLAIGCRPWPISEGRTPDLELLARHGVFLEFLAEGDGDPGNAVGPDALDEGYRYRVLVTTPGGLVRYELGDMVEGRGPGFIRFAGRIQVRISVFGEHVEGAKLAEAVGRACDATDSVCTEFHVAPVFPSANDSRGAHEWWIEFSRPPLNLSLFAHEIDAHLRREVMDYEAHRAGDAQLLPPRIRIVSNGTFHRTLASLGKLGGQHKIPIAWPNRTWAERLDIHDTGDRR